MTFFSADEVYQLSRVAGLLGFFFYPAVFAALQFGMLDGGGLMYPVLNVLAASLVLVSLAGESNLVSALIQVSWIAIGCTGIFLRIGFFRPGNRSSQGSDLTRSGLSRT
ncbi:MAG: hypothetical protein AAF714_09690 [Pseudomonadota bacterium]